MGKGPLGDNRLPSFTGSMWRWPTDFSSLLPLCPIFPEVLTFLREAWEAAPEGPFWIFPSIRNGEKNLRTWRERAITRAGFAPWPRLWQTDAYVDKGYRGHDYAGNATVHLAGSSHRGLSRTKRKRRRRRSAVEPIIGHMKSDHRMDRCFLKGLISDEANAILAAAGLNLRKLLRGFVFALVSWLTRLAQAAFAAVRPPNPAPIAA